MKELSKKKAMTRHRIIHAAKSLMEQKGSYESIEEITKTAGLSRPTFFTYFKRLCDLFDAIAVDEIKHILEYAKVKNQNEQHPQKRIANLLYTIVDEISYAPQLHMELISRYAFSDKNPMQGLQDEIEKELRSNNLQEFNPRELSIAILGSVFNLAIFGQKNKDVDAKTVVNKILDACCLYYKEQ